TRWTASSVAFQVATTLSQSCIGETPGCISPGVSYRSAVADRRRYLPRRGLQFHCRRVRQGAAKLKVGQLQLGMRRLLSARKVRARGNYTTDKCDELPPVHSITSSARLISIGGISRLSALAVLRLMMNSNFEGRSMGMSPTLPPPRTVSA